MQDRRTFLKTTGVALTGLTVAGCAETLTGSSTSLSVMGVSTGSTTPPWQAIEDQGLADEYDTEFDIAFESVPSGQEQFRFGEVEVGHFGLEATVRVNDAEDDSIRVITPLNRMHHAAVAHSDTGIESLDDLIASKDDVVIGTLPQGSANYNFLDAILQNNDEEIEEYDVRTGPPPAVYGFAQQGEIDVLCSFPAFVTNLLVGDFQLAFTYFDQGQAMWDVPTINVPITTRQNVIDEKPGAVNDFVNLWWDAGQYVIDNQEQVVDDYADDIGVSTDAEKQEFIDYTEDIYVTEHDEELTQGAIRQLEAQYELGNLEVEPDVDTIFVDPTEL